MNENIVIIERLLMLRNEIGYLKKELPQLVKMAGFRNIIVHDYAKVDDAEVYGIFKKRLTDFEQYARAIESYLASA